MPNLKSQAKTAFIWDFSGRLLMQGSGFVVTIFLARLLEPAAFGLIAMAAVIVGLAQIFTDVGLTGALIHSRSVLPVHYSSVFYFNISVALILTTITYFSAKLIADFYDNKDIIPLVEVLSFSFLIQSLSSVQGAKLAKELHYPLLTKSKITASMTSGIIGIGLAFYGAGVWSLVAQSLSMGIVYALLLWSTSGWRPSLLFSLKALVQLWSFGFRMFLSGFLATIVSQIDILIIGKLFPPATLGFFQRAKSLNELAVKYSSGSLMSILFPLLSKVQKDLPRFQNIVIKSLGIISFVVFLLLGALYLIAHDLIILIFSEKWLPSVEYFKILVLSGFAFPVSALLVNVLSSRGNSKDFLNLEIFKVIIFAANLYVGFLFGIKGYLYGLIIAMSIAVLLNIFYASREIKLKFFIFVKPLIIQASISFIAVIVTDTVLQSIDYSNFVMILYKGSTFSICYIFINWIFQTTSYLYFLEQISLVIKSKNKLTPNKIKEEF